MSLFVVEGGGGGGGGGGGIYNVQFHFLRKRP